LARRRRVAAEHAWEQQVLVLDVTHPGAAQHLGTVYRSLADDGFSYHKIDFLYAGALPGRRHLDAGNIEAYREGLRIIRDAVGEDAVLLGCGAPLLPTPGRPALRATRPGPAQRADRARRSRRR
jgi:alpha-galactosidase